jgi:hypothetical protein
MGRRQYTPSLHATTLESNKSHDKLRGDPFSLSNKEGRGWTLACSIPGMSCTKVAKSPGTPRIVAGHRSHAVRRWIRQHNHQGKRGAVGVRVVVGQLPSKSPWLNPIEPKWVHGKRAVAEPDRLLSADELAARVYAYYDCEPEAPLVIPKKVA